MAKAEVYLYKKRTGQRDRDMIEQTTIEEVGCKTTVGWIKSMIHTYFPEFVISERLILMSRTLHGYAAMRSILPEPPDHYAWMYLEIIPIKEEEKEPPNPVRRKPVLGRTMAHL